MKLITKFLIFILSFFLLCPSTNVYAEPRYETYYGIDISSISDLTTKEYVSSLYLKQEGDAYRLIVNNVSVGSVTSTGTLSYSPNAYVTIRFNIDIPNRKITFNSTKLKVESVDAVLDFSASNFNDPEYQELTIRPNKESGTSVTLKAKLNDNGWFYFDNYTYNYNGVGKDFKISLNSADGSIYNNGTPVGKLNGDNTVTVKLWYEDDIQEDDYLSLDYLKQFTKFPFEKEYATTAQTVHYGQNTIENALRSYTGDHNKILRNNLTTDRINFTLSYYIYTRPRLNPGANIGDGVYGETDGKIQVICEWSDDACASVRSKFGEAGRLFAVVDNKNTYNKLTTISTQREADNIDLYTNPTSYFQSSSDYKDGQTQASIRTASWTNWSDWTTSRWPDSAILNSGPAKEESRDAYRYRTQSWTNWSDWTTSRWNTAAIENSKSVEESKSEYSDYYYGESKSGNYTDKCEYNYYEKNYACGQDAKYSNPDGYKTNKYGYTETCESRTGKNSECGVSSYSYSDYSGWSTSKSGSYTDKCDSQYTQHSSCSCKKYATSGTKCGYTYSSYAWKSSSTYSGVYDCGPVQKSGPYKNQKYCATKRTEKACSAAGCSERNYCTTYNCPKKRTSNYYNCTSYKCYQNKDMINKSCYLYYCPHKKTVYYRYRNKTYSTWSNYNYTSCPYLSGVTVECEGPQRQYRYMTKAWGSWSAYSGNLSSALSPDDMKQYMYRVKYKGKGLEAISKYKEVQEIINSRTQMTKSEIYSLRDQYNEAYAYMTTIDQAIKDSENKILSIAEYNTWKNGIGASTYQSKLNNKQNADGFKFIQAPYFVPYVYIRAHTRAESKDTLVKAFNSSSSYNWEARYSENPSPDGPHPLEEYEEPVSRDSKVIYYDYKDPLVNYGSVIPSELEGLEAVINALKNSDLEQEKISVKISKEDIDNMKNWLNDNHYVTGKDSCELLKAFAYIFDDATKSRILSQSCSVH